MDERDLLIEKQKKLVEKIEKLIKEISEREKEFAKPIDIYKLLGDDNGKSAPVRKGRSKGTRKKRKKHR